MDSHSPCGFRYGAIPTFELTDGLHLCKFPPYGYGDMELETFRERSRSGAPTPQEISSHKDYPAQGNDGEEQDVPDEQG